MFILLTFVGTIAVGSSIQTYYTHCFGIIAGHEYLAFSYICPLPKLVDDVNQVFVCKLKGPLPPNFSAYWWIALCMVDTTEVIYQENFFYKSVVILDYEHLTMDHVLSITPMYIKHALVIFEKILKSRLKEFHVINSPGIVDILLKLAKSLVKPKLYEKIILHQSIESLIKYVPLDILPKDYGGKEKSLIDLQEDWKAKLDEYQDRFDKLDTLKVNESLRPTPMKDSDLFGTEGTFKNLSVD